MCSEINAKYMLASKGVFSFFKKLLFATCDVYDFWLAVITYIYVAAFTPHYIQLKYQLAKMRVHWSEWISNKINTRHLEQLKK